MRLSRRECLRRVILLCCHFARNVASYRAGKRNGQVLPETTEFWVTVNGNFVDQAVLEWCKLVGDKKGQQSWGMMGSDTAAYARELLETVEWAEVDMMR